MNSIVLVTLTLLLTSTLSQAQSTKVKSLSESEAKIPIARTSSVVVLGQNSQTDKTYRLVVVDNGQSTDVSPRFSFFLTYFHGGESNNSQTAFYLGSFSGLIATERAAPGVYAVTVSEMSPQTGETEKVTLTLDVHQVALDEKRLSASWEEMSDPYFQSSINVSR